MIGTGLVILGAMPILVVAGVVASQAAPQVPVEVREDAARREDALRRRRARDQR